MQYATQCSSICGIPDIEKAETPDIPCCCGEHALWGSCSYVVGSYRARPTPHSDYLSEGLLSVRENTYSRVDRIISAIIST